MDTTSINLRDVRWPAAANAHADANAAGSVAASTVVVVVICCMHNLIGGSLHRASTLFPLLTLNIVVSCSFPRRRRASCCLGL